MTNQTFLPSLTLLKWLKAKIPSPSWLNYPLLLVAPVHVLTDGLSSLKISPTLLPGMMKKKFQCLQQIWQIKRTYIFQTFWDSCPNADFNLIKESYGNETPDYFQRKFNEYTRRPREPVFDNAHRLKTNFNKCYPPSSSVTADNSNEQQS